MTRGDQLRSYGKLSVAGPPSTFPQPPQLRRRANVLTMSLDESVNHLPGTYTGCWMLDAGCWMLDTTKCSMIRVFCQGVGGRIEYPVSRIEDRAGGRGIKQLPQAFHVESTGHLERSGPIRETKE